MLLLSTNNNSVTFFTRKIRYTLERRKIIIFVWHSAGRWAGIKAGRLSGRQ
jgi:hypothetical protein